MLLQLLPRDITKHWDGISEAISKSLPPITSMSKDRMTVILKSLMAGTMQCWILHEPDGIYAVGTTEFATDPGSKTKNLLIFSLFGLRPVSQEMWMEGYKTLQKFARANGCESIIAFTDIPGVAGLVERLGGNADTRLIVMGVDNEQ